jgi:hypothetical protein
LSLPARTGAIHIREAEGPSTRIAVLVVAARLNLNHSQVEAGM